MKHATQLIYSSDKHTGGMWRGQILKDLNNGQAYVYIPGIHRNTMPFKTETVEVTDENGEPVLDDEGNVVTKVQVTQELAPEHEKTLVPPAENETQLESTTSEPDSTETSSSETPTEEPDENTEDTESSAETENDDEEESSEDSDSTESNSNVSSETAKFPIANVCAWQQVPKFTTGESVWIVFENGDVNLPVIMGQFGSMLEVGSFDSITSSSSSSNYSGINHGVPAEEWDGNGTVSELVDYILLSPNHTAPRGNKIDKITIHHMAGNLTVEQCGEIFYPSSRRASSHYGVDNNGRIGMYVIEENRAWTSSNTANDNRAITIEVANDDITTYHVSDIALETTIKLCVDICIRNNIDKLNYTGDATGNLTMHRWFASTSCPGDYLASKFPYIAEQVNAELDKQRNN